MRFDLNTVVSFHDSEPNLLIKRAYRISKVNFLNIFFKLGPCIINQMTAFYLFYLAYSNLCLFCIQSIRSTFLLKHYLVELAKKRLVKQNTNLDRIALRSLDKHRTTDQGFQMRSITFFQLKCFWSYKPSNFKMQNIWKSLEKVYFTENKRKIKGNTYFVTLLSKIKGI